MPVARRAWARRVTYGVMLVTGTALLFFRVAEGARNVVWAEDGAVFLEQTFSGRFVENLFTPYAGYMHLYPRLAGEIVSHVFPTASLGVGMNIAGAFAWAGVALTAFVFTSSRLTVFARFALWALVLLLPIGSWETATNVANSHWFLMFGVFVVLATRSDSLGRIVFGSAVVAVGVMSDPLNLIFVPLVVVRLVTVPGWRNRIPGLVYVASMLVQIALVASTSRQVGAKTPELEAYGSTYSLRVVVNTLLGPTWGQDVYESVTRLPLIIGGLVVVVALAGLLALRWRQSGLGIAALFFSITFFVMVNRLTWKSIEVPAPDEIIAWAGRYSVLPSLLLYLAIIVLLDQLLRLRGRRARILGTVVALIVVGGLASSGISNFQHERSIVAGAPDMQIEAEHAETACAFDPSAIVELHIAPAPWVIRTPCSALRN